PGTRFHDSYIDSRPSSGDVEVLAQRLADHRGSRLVVAPCPPGQRLAQLGIEPYRLDARGSRAERWTSTPAAQDLVDVVSALGLLGQLSDELVGDRNAARRLAVGLLRH